MNAAYVHKIASKVAVKSYLVTILTQARKGNFGYCFTEKIPAPVQEYLISLGYTVRNGGSGAVTYVFW